MQLHYKIQMLRQILRYNHSDMGTRMNISGSAYGKMERGETHPGHERIQQLSAIFQVPPHTLTDNEPLYLCIYQNEKGRVALQCREKDNQQQQRMAQLEEEVTRLRKFIDDIQYLNDKQKDIIETQAGELKKRKKR